MKNNIYIAITIFAIILCKTTANAQLYQQGIDTVYSFTPGPGQNFGQDSNYFPQNIFGPPDTSARLTKPSADPKHILSFGFGGEIVVGFKNYQLIDGPGPDFTIFENAFVNELTEKVFAEPAKVSVSQDGFNFIEFPYDEETLQGCAGVTPTNGAQDPFNPQESGGDSFDIAVLGLSQISYIKITDISEPVKNNPTHKFYDPIISGFDLDAVVGLYLIESNPMNIEQEGIIDEDVKVIETDKVIIFELNNKVLSEKSISFYNIYGNKIFSNNSKEKKILSKEKFPKGVYFYIIFDNNKKYCGKFLVD